MPIASIHRIHADETASVLLRARAIIERSGASLIEGHRAPALSESGGPSGDDTVVLIARAATRGRGGAPARHPQYAVDMSLIVLFELAWRGDTFSWTRFVYALWFRYTDDEMASIGLSGWRDPARAAAMRPAAFRAAGETTSYVRELGAEDLRRLEASQRLWRAEVARAQFQLTRLLAPIDDTPLPAARRHTIDATAAARTEEHEAARALCRQVMNRMVRAGLEVANTEYYPDVAPEDLSSGLLRGFKGDVGMDEHNVAVSTSYGQRTKVRSAKSLARYAGHVRREKQAMAVGLSAAIAVSRPDCPKVPPVLVAFDLHDAASEANAGARNALEAMEANGLRPEVRGRGHQYIVVDKAYPYYVGFNKHLLANRWTIVGKYVTATDKMLKGGAPFADMSPADAPASGPYQFNGVFLCPGIGAKYLAENRGFDIPRDQDVTPEWLASNDATVRQLTAAIMPTNGRPKSRKQNRRGRPAANARPIEDQWTVEVRCPAAAENPKVRCPRVAHSMQLPENEFPTLHLAPKAEEPAPKCCTDDHGAMQLNLNEKHIKNWQTLMAGSWEHQDFYAPARTTTERYFGRLMNPQTGDLSLGKIEWQRNAFVAMAITATVLVTNARVIDKWEEDLRSNGDVPPAGHGPRRRAWRQHLRKK
jgi:hypothetical protein